MLKVSDKVSVKGWSGIAFKIKSIEDNEVIARMVGDDREHIIDLDDCQLLADNEYCPECGQIGCGHYQND